MAACEGFLQRHPENSGAMVAKIIPLGKIENLTWSDDFNRFVLSFNLRMGKHIGELLGETSGPIAIILSCGRRRRCVLSDQAE